jgi:hypothetical protein
LIDAAVVPCGLAGTLDEAVSDVAPPAPLEYREPARRVVRVRPSRRVVVPVALFAAAALISGFTMLQAVDPFDEGLVLQAARRVAGGQVPYRDFLWAYGPAQPYLLAALSKLFGPSLIQWRILRVLADAGVSLSVYALARRAGARPVVALAAWLAVAGEMAEPRSANPFPFALLAALVAFLVATGGGRRRVAVAAALTAVAAAFRLDFGLYALAGVAVTFGLRDGRGPASRYLLASVGVTVLAYVPFAILDGPASLYDALIGTSLRTGSYWTLPFPLHFHAPPHAGLAKTAKKLVDFYVPALLVVGAALSAVGVAVVARRERRPPALDAGLLVFAAGGLAYLLSRTDEFHTAPLYAVVAALLAALAARRAGLGLAVVCAAALSLLLVHGVANRISAATRPPAMSAIDLPVADGAEAPPAEARALERMVALVQARVPPGRPIYVAPRRSDLVRFNNPLVYVLTGRDNPTREDFGLQAGAAAQRRIVAVLARVRPRAIVRWTDPLSSRPEPNAGGRATGVRILDSWISAHYQLLERLYHYDVLVPRR